MPKINNIMYNKFRSGDFIDLINEDKIIEVLNNIKGKYKDEARSLIIFAYYSGARPEEYLSIKPLDCQLQNKWLMIKIITVKRGSSRIIMLDVKKKLVKEFLEHIHNTFPDNYLFMHFRGETKKRHITKKGEEKVYLSHSQNLNYHFKKWFKDIPPYYLRHNRFSKLAINGISLQDLQQMKGAKTINSIQPYLHMSTDTAKKISKKND